MAARVFDFQSGGATIIDFDGNHGYFVNINWRPGVAERRFSELGGRGPYGDVQEEIPLVVRGASSDQVVQRRDALAMAVDQAYTWLRRGNVNPVYMRYRSGGSTLATPTVCPVLGPVPGKPTLSFSGWPELVGVNYQQDVVFRFVRHGQHLGVEDWAVSSQVEAAVVSSVTMGNEERWLSPTRLLSSDLAVSGGGLTPVGFVVLVKEKNMEVLTGGVWTGWSTDSSAGDNALDSLTHTTTGADSHVLLSVGAGPTNLRAGNRVQTFVAARVDGANTTWKVTPYLQIANAPSFPADGSFIVGASTYIRSQSPQVYPLSSIAIPSAKGSLADFGFMYVRYERLEGTGMITVNYHVLVNSGDGECNILKITQGADNNSQGGLLVDHQLPDLPTPLVGFLGATQPLGSVIPLAYRGNPYFYTMSENLEILYLLTEQDTTDWRPGVFNETTTVTRRSGYLLPQ